MKIAVCGDSWFSVDKGYQGGSFAELLCQQNDYELLSLARSGCCNFTISLQIDEAIKQNSDFIVVGTTTADRIVLPALPDNKTKYTLEWKRLFQSLNRKFLYSEGLNNIDYMNHYKIVNKDFSVISNTLNNLLHFDKRITTEQKEALSMYINYIHDANIKSVMDAMIISDSCRKIKVAGIPFVLFAEHINRNPLLWIDELVDDFSVKTLPSSTKVYHYNQEGSQLFADYIQKRITKVTNTA